MHDQKIIDEIKQKLYTSKGQLNSAILRRDYFTNGDLCKKIKNSTSFLPDNATHSERIYCILNNITKTPTCKCGKPLTWKGYQNKPYNKSCPNSSCKRLTNTWKSSSQCKIKKEKIKKEKFNELLNNEFNFIDHNELMQFCEERLQKSTPFNTSLFNTHPFHLATLIKLSYLNYHDKIKWSQLFYNFIKNITLQPKCPKCSTPYTFRNSIYGYSLCSIQNCLQLNSCNTRKKNHNQMVRQFLLEDGYELLTDHGLNEGKHAIKHQKCNTIFDVSISNGNWQTKVLCPECYPNTSRFQNEVYQYITKQLNIKCNINNRGIIDPLEIDIFIPSHNIAIECNGIYWHTESNGKSKNYHKLKYKQCRSKNIQLIQIWESEWNNKQNIVKSIIANKLGKYNNKIYARKCTIKKIVCKHTKADFLNNNHLQGNDNSQISYGLLYNNELVAIMTFGHRKIVKGNYNEWEMIRFCTKQNCIVIGGASKLLKHFIHIHAPKNIITYADLRYSQGDLYNQIGFNFIHESAPGYWYVVKGQLKHRSGFMKHRLSKILKNYDENLSEYQNMLNNGFDRIWDCGHAVFNMQLT